MIAYISPLVPKRTGIALYSHHLIKALQQDLMNNNDSLTAFDDDVSATNQYQSDYIAQEILPLLFEKKRRQKYSQFIYHFGNNPAFHLPILQLLQRQKGIVVLHDTVLYYLIAGQSSGGLWQAFTRQSLAKPLDVINDILENSTAQDILAYPSPANHPLLHEVLVHASAVVVHSQMAERHIRQSGFKGSVYQVPLIDYQHVVCADESTIESTIVSELFTQKKTQGLFIIGLFGFAGETKRSQSIFRALSELPSKLKSQIKLLIVGHDLYSANIRAMELSDLVVNTGYVSDSDYDQSMAICDLIINLRYPSMGETSAVQIQAMSAGKATIVSDHAWFSELADNAVHKIAIGEQEVEELKQGIVKMVDDHDYRQSVAQQAKQYINTYHSPDYVAQQWRSIIAENSPIL